MTKRHHKSSSCNSFIKFQVFLEPNNSLMWGTDKSYLRKLFAGNPLYVSNLICTNKLNSTWNPSFIIRILGLIVIVFIALSQNCFRKTSQTFPTKLAAFWCGLLFRLHSLVLVNYPYLLLNMTDYRSKWVVSVTLCWFQRWVTQKFKYCHHLLTHKSL